jgi:HKD family nuclease
MKERGISARVARVTSIDISKPALLDSIGFASSLSAAHPGIPLMSAIKSHKLQQYKAIISYLQPVADEFSQLSKHHSQVLQKLQALDLDIRDRIEKSANAVKIGKNVQQELCEMKAKRSVIDQILAKLEENNVKIEFETGNESVLTALNRSLNDLSK